MDALSLLNRLPADEARAAFGRCCGSAKWIERMVAARPFSDPARLYAVAEESWNHLSPDDWREAFLTAIRKKTGCIKVAFNFADAAA